MMIEPSITRLFRHITASSELQRVNSSIRASILLLFEIFVWNTLRVVP